MINSSPTMKPVAFEVELRITEQRERAVGKGERTLVVSCSSISPAGFDATFIFTRMSSVTLAKGPRPNSDIHVAESNCRKFVPQPQPSDVQANGDKLLAAGLVAESGLEDGQSILGLQPLPLSRFCSSWDSLYIASHHWVQNTNRYQFDNQQSKDLHKGNLPTSTHEDNRQHTIPR